MALPPTVPTSFVPHAASAQVRRRSNFTGAFAFVGYGVLAVVLALSIGTFVYAQILTTEQASKDKALQKQIAAIDPHTVSKFVRLRDRLSYSQTLLNRHMALSGFWTAVNQVAPATVRFKSTHLSRDESGVIKLEATGVAKSFNALAATSDAFAKDGRIKDVIFSSIRVDGNAVTFAMTSTLDPALVEFSPEASSATAAPAPEPKPATGTTTTP